MTEPTRRHTLGASEVAAIFGFSRFSSPYALWAKLHGLTTDAPTGATLRGQIIEPAFRDWYAGRLGVKVTPGPRYEDTPWQRLDLPWQAARPDGHWIDTTGLHLIEIKTTRDWYAWHDGPPPDYRFQVLWQQWVAAGMSWDVPLVDTHLIAYCPMGEDFRDFQLAWDERTRSRAARLSELVTAWWERHIIGGEPPEVDEHSATREALRQVYARPNRVYLDATPELSALVDDYRTEKAAYDAAKDKKELARNRLVAAIGHHAGIDGLCSFSAGKNRALTLKGEES